MLPFAALLAIAVGAVAIPTNPSLIPLPDLPYNSAPIAVKRVSILPPVVSGTVSTTAPSVTPSSLFPIDSSTPLPSTGGVPTSVPDRDIFTKPLDLPPSTLSSVFDKAATQSEVPFPFQPFPPAGLRPEVLRVDDDGSSLVAYYPTTPEDPAPVERRDCGNYSLECNWSHQARATVCGSLLSELNGYPDSWVNQSPRSICRQALDGTCCISWSSTSSSQIYYKDLSGNAENLVRNCVSSEQFVSGLIRNVWIGGTCMTECLSGRPDGCH